MLTPQTLKHILYKVIDVKPTFPKYKLNFWIYVAGLINGKYIPAGVNILTNALTQYKS